MGGGSLATIWTSFYFQLMMGICSELFLNWNCWGYWVCSWPPTSTLAFHNFGPGSSIVFALVFLSSERVGLGKRREVMQNHSLILYLMLLQCNTLVLILANCMCVWCSECQCCHYRHILLTWFVYCSKVAVKPIFSLPVQWFTTMIVSGQVNNFRK